MAEAASSLFVATPERVRLSVPVVGFGYRALAYGVDVLSLLALWVSLYFAVSLAPGDPLTRALALPTWARVAAVLVLFFSQWCYWTLFETFGGGQSFGKRVLGIRVVREDGAKVGFFDSAVRNLLRAVDFLPLGYAVGGLTMLLTERHQRLGDLAAGTVLMRDRAFNLGRYVQTPAGEPSRSTRLSALESELLLEFLERAPQLTAKARDGLLEALITRFGTHLSAFERGHLVRDFDAAEAYLRGLARGEA